MNKLNISENQFGVGKAEFSTGIVLKNDGSYFLSDVEAEDVYQVFETYEAAKEFAKKEVESNPKIECFIINSKNEMIFQYNQDDKNQV